MLWGCSMWLLMFYEDNVPLAVFGDVVQDSQVVLVMALLGYTRLVQSHCYLYDWAFVLDFLRQSLFFGGKISLYYAVREIVRLSDMFFDIQVGLACIYAMLIWTEQHGSYSLQNELRLLYSL